VSFALLVTGVGALIHIYVADNPQRRRAEVG
jgi:hypothetical protein